MSSSIQEDRPYSGHAHLSWSPGDARQTLVGCVEKEDGSQEGSWVLLMAPHLRAIQEVLRMRSWWDHLAPATEWLSGDTSLSYGSFLAYEVSFSLLVKSIILIKPYFNFLMLLKISFFFFCTRTTQQQRIFYVKRANNFFTSSSNFSFPLIRNRNINIQFHLRVLAFLNSKHLKLGFA